MGKSIKISRLETKCYIKSFSLLDIYFDTFFVCAYCTTIAIYLVILSFQYTNLLIHNCGITITRIIYIYCLALLLQYNIFYHTQNSSVSDSLYCTFINTWIYLSAWEKGNKLEIIFLFMMNHCFNSLAPLKLFEIQPGNLMFRYIRWK